MLESKDITPRDKNGKAHGLWKIYWDNGILDHKGTYHHGNAHGYWESYWPDGNIYYKGNYHHGQQHGYWEWFNQTIYYARM